MSSDSSLQEEEEEEAMDDSSSTNAATAVSATPPFYTTTPSPSLLSKEVSFGRIKEPPNCVDESMRALATPTEELRKLAFPLVNGRVPTVSIPESQHHHPHQQHHQHSRQGRQHQRWKPGGVRQVTGCIPILQNSKILLISASRKNTWIMPKGGWEQDETMAESAVRETYEEAGVAGVLRKLPFSPVLCRSRKVDSPNTEVSFYCLYVQHVAEHWPEHGRLRRAVPIETALELVRPEFKAILTAVQTQLLLNFPSTDTTDDVTTAEDEKGNY